MAPPRYNADGSPLTADQIAIQQADDALRKRAMASSDEVKAVLVRGKFLKDHIGEIIEVYTKGGVRGFKFVPADYDGLRRKIDEHIQEFVTDGQTSTGQGDMVGAIMGSDAHKHGFLLSLRQKSDYGSLHIELKPDLCDAHVDSVSITANSGQAGNWGDEGQYDPTKFPDHFVKDLLPFYLEHPPPIPVFGTLLKNPGVYDAVTKVLSRTSIDLRIKGRYDEADPYGFAGAPRKDTRLVFNFSVIEWK